MKQEENKTEKIVNLAKRRGFIFPGSELYGGLAGTYDYGPLGFLLKKNIEQTWRESILQYPHTWEIDPAIMMSPRVWEASGHVGSFSDPLVEHKKTNQRFRVDHLLEEIGVQADEKMTLQEIQKMFDDNFEKLSLPSKKREEYTEVKQFNMLVQSNMGDLSGDGEDPVYLRPETAQGTYLNYKNTLDSMPVKIPFGLFTSGKAFRNEIKPRQFVFRTREFTQMEFQYFTHPDMAAEQYEQFKKDRMDYYVNDLGIAAENLRFLQHENLVFYAKDAWDVEYNFDFGWKEIEGIHWRSDYDLTQHETHSGVKLKYQDPQTGEWYMPHVLEMASGLDRNIFMVMYEAYREDEVNGEVRTYLNLPAKLAPIKIAVSPLLKNKPELVEKGQEIFTSLKKSFGQVMWDDNGNIGKRYRRQDEIGTPYCVVIDFETLEGETIDTVTVRDRNTTEQERVAISDLEEYFEKKLR
jgi:glycyl-tRNA synthetase